MGMSCNNDVFFPLGSLVIVTRGKCAGAVCAVIGNYDKPECGRMLLIADGRALSAKKPKRKNPKHLTKLPGSVVSVEIAQRLAQGTTLDDGWLNEAILRRMRENLQLNPEEVCSFEWQKTTSLR